MEQVIAKVRRGAGAPLIFVGSCSSSSCGGERTHVHRLILFSLFLILLPYVHTYAIEVCVYAYCTQSTLAAPSKNPFLLHRRRRYTAIEGTLSCGVFM
jgi:hypothetical protein